MNISVISGRLVSDPEIKTTSNGSNMLAFCVAVDRGDKARTTDFIGCIAWREEADFIAEWFKKGSGIEIVGELNTRTYEKRAICDRLAIKVLKQEIGDLTLKELIYPNSTEFDELFKTKEYNL